MHMSNPIAQHAINGGAIVFPVASVWLHLPEVLSVILTLAGIGWYGVLFYDRFIKKD